MAYILLLISLFVVLPLAVNRGDLKRIIFLAIGIEVLKYLFIFTLGDFLANLENETVSFFLVIFNFVAMLPELSIGHSHEPIPVWVKIAALCGGVVWNLIPAYLIALFLPEKRVTADIDSKLSSSSRDRI